MLRVEVNTTSTAPQILKLYRNHQQLTNNVTAMLRQFPHKLAQVLLILCLEVLPSRPVNQDFIIRKHQEQV